MMDQVTSPADIPDEVLIGRIVAGENRLFEHIMRRYNQRLYRTGMSILSDDMDVEDAMQTTYISAYQHLEKFEGRSAFSTWLTRIMLNECLARKKKNAKAKQEFVQSSETPKHMITPAHLLANKELSTVLEHAVRQLPDKYRLVFVLREIEDMSVKETSDALSIEESNVKTRLNRAKTMLRESLGGYLREHVYSFHLTRCDRIVNNVLAHLKLV
jgi:RNA polymerase sigma-70 factor (ECF subfamily)